MIETDFLVIGSGIAGLSFALKASQMGRVLVITKDVESESSTKYAQGGIAAVLGLEDSFQAHVEDTLRAGAGLCKREAVRVLVEEGPERIKELIDWGAEFTRRSDSANYDRLDLGREGGHSQRRVVHAADFTGAEVERALLSRVADEPNIEIHRRLIAIDLITRRWLERVQGRPRSDKPDVCFGAYALNKESGEIHRILARVVMLTTGGAGKVYLYTSNPDVATGDGIAMAYRAGAVIANMEFFQFHPTCLFHPAAKSFLISEALRGEGAVLKLRNGDTFMERYHPLGSLAPRDIVARAIDSEMKKRGDEHVLLDISHVEPFRVKERFPNIYEKCLDFGFDITKEPIPVVPAAHYACGGVATDLDGRTSIPNLYATGETACTGVHGANRLASNSLLEALVFSHRAYLSVKREWATFSKEEPDGEVPQWDVGKAVPSDEMVVVSQNWDEIRRAMWNYVGIVRSDKRLARAQRRIDLLQEEIREYYWRFFLTADLIELRNIAQVADLVVRSALMRKESRGLHYTLDYPDRDDEHWLHDTRIQREL